MSARSMTILQPIRLEGVRQAEKNLGAKVEYIETRDVKDFEKNIATFGEAGYDVVVTVGFGLGEATIKAAAAYPNTRFIGVDQYQDTSQPIPANLVGLIFPEDQAGFLVGALAAQMTKTGKVGAILGTDVVPPVWRFGEGYRAGAQYIKPDVKVYLEYHNDVGFDKTFSDPIWGAATANKLIDQDVDVIFGAGGTTGTGLSSRRPSRACTQLALIGTSTTPCPKHRKRYSPAQSKILLPAFLN